MGTHRYESKEHDQKKKQKKKNIDYMLRIIYLLSLKIKLGRKRGGRAQK
jgi:hypothetical protein